MAANLSRLVPPDCSGRRRASVALATLILIPGVAAGWWWWTESRDHHGTRAAPVRVPAVSPRRAARQDRQSVELPAWPEERLEGRPATRLLLDTLLAVRARLETIDCYTATFRKQERIDGSLGPEQTLAMKVRHRPFAIYFKFLAPKPGKEVVYAEGRHENLVIAHAGGWARRLVPRLAVPPTHPLALAENRHPVTEAGLAHLTAKLVAFRRIDLDDPDARTVLDRTTGPDGRPWLRSTHLHSHRDPNRPFARVEVLYDPTSRFPLRISNYDWPTPGETGQLRLAERYAYDDLNLDADLSALDFDPANPAYAFHRY
jgi:hypothetical protein